MKFFDSKKILPKCTDDLQEEVFCVSNVKQVGLARWANLSDEEPDGGHDHDEYEFKYIGCYVDPLFWMGPIEGVFVSIK